LVVIDDLMLHSVATSPDSASPGLTWVSLSTAGAGFSGKASGSLTASGVVGLATLGLSWLHPTAAVRTRMAMVVFMRRILPHKLAASRDLARPVR
jgi:hypothetical protein